jgi:hypothetical protein
VSYLPIGAEVVRPYQVARIDLAAVNEFVDLDGARGLQRDLFELLLGDLDELIVFELVPLYDPRSAPPRRYLNPLSSI